MTNTVTKKKKVQKGKMFFQSALNHFLLICCLQFHLVEKFLTNNNYNTFVYNNVSSQNILFKSNGSVILCPKYITSWIKMKNRDYRVIRDLACYFISCNSVWIKVVNTIFEDIVKPTKQQDWCRLLEFVHLTLFQKVGGIRFYQNQPYKCRKKDPGTISSN